MPPLILASSSEIRHQLLSRAGVPHELRPARIDEDAVKTSLVAEGAPPRDIADQLAELKARKVAMARPGALVLGCDQVLDLGGVLLSKPADLTEAAEQLRSLSGRSHHLHSAAVIYEEARPVWRHVSRVRMTMRPLSEAFIAGYLARNPGAATDAVGAYHVEEEGVRLFARIEGDHFAIQGLPLVELLSYLVLRGFLDT